MPKSKLSVSAVVKSEVLDSDKAWDAVVSGGDEDDQIELTMESDEQGEVTIRRLQSRHDCLRRLAGITEAAKDALVWWGKWTPPVPGIIPVERVDNANLLRIERLTSEEG